MSKVGRCGFTLLELSIVLVIIGLIAGGVLVGRDLIHAAQLRSMHKDYEAISAAVNAFKIKYNCLPGDCASATEFFGSAGDCPVLSGLNDSPGDVTPEHNATPRTVTCNGDSDGLIDIGTTFEEFTFWQQLADAGVVPGIYSGGNPAGGTLWVPGINVPIIRGWSNATWFAVNGDNFNLLAPYSGQIPLSLSLTPDHLGNVLFAMSLNMTVFTSDEMLSYDTKFDDGSPITGKIREVAKSAPIWGVNGGCVNNANQYIGVTDPSYTGKPACNPMYINAW